MVGSDNVAAVVDPSILVIVFCDYSFFNEILVRHCFIHSLRESF